MPGVMHRFKKHFTETKSQPDSVSGVRHFFYRAYHREALALKIALFATGCAGIVAEYVLSTLATYLIGNAITQWTLVMSLMLFAMGLGSRLSRYFETNLLDTFILVEFLLSVLCAVCAVVAYGFSAYTNSKSLLIYSQAVMIGCLIGLEIPLVTRLNEMYEELKVNISSVMEKDYWGALLGGGLFAFVALPYLGLTFTPIVLGGINFTVAIYILWCFYPLLKRKRLLLAGSCGLLCFFILLCFFAEPIILHGEQKKYRDTIIYSKQTPYQKIVMTQWKSYYWLFINGQEQFATFDEEKYHEPLVHPVLNVSVDPADVLVLGGGDGLAVREILKHKRVRTVTLVDIDPEMTHFAQTHPVMRAINKGALTDPRVTVINADAAVFFDTDQKLYGAIIIDLPDPDSVDLMHVYSKNFYRRLKKSLIKGGALVTQATSPYFSNLAFLSILKTITQAGFATLPYHNQIPTMGEWGWVMALSSEDNRAADLKALVLSKDFSDIDTRFLNSDAMVSMTHFGKGIIDQEKRDGIESNTEIDPVLYRYYSKGAWGMY